MANYIMLHQNRIEVKIDDTIVYVIILKEIKIHMFGVKDF